MSSQYRRTREIIRERRGVVTATTTETIGDKEEVVCAGLIMNRDKDVASNSTPKARRMTKSATRSGPCAAIIVNANVIDEDRWHARRKTAVEDGCKPNRERRS